MNTRQIQKQLRGYKNFIGVYPSDSIPPLGIGEAVIVNTDPQDKPGEHWVAMYMSEEVELEYFDSFGIAPLSPNIQEYISVTPHLSFSYSTIQLQHEESETCGNHCIAYVKHRLSGQPLVCLVAHYTSNPKNNDRRVYVATKGRA